MNAGSQEQNRRDQPVIGDPRPRQVRTFIEQIEPGQVDVFRLIWGGVRGRMFPALSIGSLLGLVFGLATLFLISPLYQSQALIRIVAREPKILYADADEARLRLFDAFVAAEVNYLSSRPVLNAAFEKLLELNPPYVPLDVGELSEDVQITSAKGLVTIVGRASDARSAAAIVNSIVDAYADQRLQQSESLLSFRTRELSNRETGLVGQLEAIDKRILAVGGEYGVDSIGKAHIARIGQIDDLDLRIDELTTAISQLETVGHAIHVDTGDAETKRSMLLDNSMASMTYDRAKKAAELAALGQRYKSDNPRLNALRAEVAVLDQAIEQRRVQIASLGQFGGLIKSGADQAQSIVELRALLAKLQNRKSEIERQARDLNARIVELNYLKEERLQLRLLLDETRLVLEQVRVESRSSTPGEAEIVAHGSIPEKPIEDKRKQMALAAFIGGVALSLTIFAVWGLLFPLIRHESDISGLGRMVALAGNLSNTPSSAHLVRNAVQLAAARIASDRGRSITIAAAGPGQGATTLTFALAESFRQAGSRVAVIDANLADPAISARYGALDRPGLKDWILGAGMASPPSSVGAGVSLLPAGLDSRAQDHTLSLPIVRQVIESLTRNHDFVLIDGGAVNGALAASLFAAETDIVLLAMRRGISRRRAQTALHALAATCRKQVLAVLIGDESPEVPAWLARMTDTLTGAPDRSVHRPAGHVGGGGSINA